MTTASLTLPSRIPEDVVCKGGGIPLIGERAFSISALEIMERSWKVHVELIITTVMGTSFRVRMSPQETILDIKRRIYYREGIPVEKQHLIWKSVELEDKVKISDYKLTSGATLQLVTAMRGGPLNIRRVPVMDESHLVRMQLAEDGMAPGMSGGRPVAVIVLQDGTELHFFQFIDSDDESSDNEQSDVESEIKSTDDPEIRQRKEANVRTRATMASLKQKMEQAKLNKKAKAAARRSPSKSPKSPVKSTSRSPTINRGSGTKLGGANIPVVVGRSAVNTTRSSTLQNKTEKKGKDSGISVSSTKRNSGSAEHQNRNDQGISSFRDHEASSSSLWAKLLVSSSKLSQLEISNASLRTADHPSATVDNRATPTDESSLSSIWLRRVQGRDEVSRTGSGKLRTNSKHSVQSSTIIKGRANKNTAASGVITRQSPVTMRDHCSYCSKKLGLIGNFQCRCGGTFCSLHRYPEAHRCQYDYKTKGRQTLAKDNPKVIAEKFPKI